MNITAIEFIRTQLAEADEDLRKYRPHEMDWPARARAVAERLAPWLEAEAEGLKSYVEGVLNAPVQLRRLWEEIRTLLALPPGRFEEFDRQLALDDVLRESVTGEIISKVVTKYLTEREPDLISNGRSDYPELCLGSLDYSGLAAFKRKAAEGEIEYGAALKGTARRPVRVPDGLEIKTCRGKIRVDCQRRTGQVAVAWPSSRSGFGGRDGGSRSPR